MLIIRKKRLDIIYFESTLANSERSKTNHSNLSSFYILRSLVFNLSPVRKDMQALLEVLSKESVLTLLFEQKHCGTCGEVDREDAFNTCVVCGASWCDSCVPACKCSPSLS